MRVNRSRWWAIAAGAAALGALPAAAEAQTYVYAGDEQTYQVPSGVTGVHVVLVGAAGSPAGDALGGSPGDGAMVTADLPVPPGAATLYVEVGGVGTAASPPGVPMTATGGFNGGGSGPLGGGGATDIRTVSCGSAPACATGGSEASLSSRLAVAGGGGAGGGVYDSISGADGRSNGGSAGLDSSGSGAAGDTSISGTGATSAFAGQPASQATVNTFCANQGGTAGEPGLAGSLGLGGAGAYLLINGPVSGGGGGGLYGGGGGAQCYATSGGLYATLYAGAGGAGSSGAPSAQNVSISTDSHPAEAIVTAPVPAPTGPPALIGRPTVGDVLTEGHGTWTSGQPISGYAYQWERCDSSGNSCTTIRGASQRTYTLQPADVGHALRVQETASNFYGQASTPGTSQATDAVAGSPAGSPPGATPRPGTPILTRLRVSPRTLSVAGRRVNGRCVKPGHRNTRHHACRRPIRLKVSYSLTTAANITFTFTRTVPGRIVNGRCTNPTARLKNHPKCMHPRAVRGKIRRAGRPGDNRFIFHGRLRGRRLGPGTYTLIAAPAGGRRHIVTFTILR